MAETKPDIVAQIKKLSETKKLVLGTNVTLKELKKGNLTKIYVSSNTPQGVRDDIEHYANMVKVPVSNIPVSNEEFGIICKKSFLISVAGERK